MNNINSELLNLKITSLEEENLKLNYQPGIKPKRLFIRLQLI